MKKNTVVHDPQSLALAISQRGAREGAELLLAQDDATAVGALRVVNPALAQELLAEISDEHRSRLLAAATRSEAGQWQRNETYEEGTIGYMMEAPTATFAPEVTVGEAVESIRELVKRTFVTYGFVTD